MSKYRHAPEITDEVIADAFGGANFGRTDYREFLGYSVLKKACGWHCGHTITTIMVGLNLITPEPHKLTKLGRMFLSDSYDDPLRTKSGHSASDIAYDPAQPGSEATVINYYQSPPGWKLVPVEPTIEMCDIGHIGIDVLTGVADDDEYYSTNGEDAARIYRAMLAAAPAPGGE